MGCGQSNGFNKDLVLACFEKPKRLIVLEVGQNTLTVDALKYGVGDYFVEDIQNVDFLAEQSNFKKNLQ